MNYRIQRQFYLLNPREKKIRSAADLENHFIKIIMSRKDLPAEGRRKDTKNPPCKYAGQAPCPLNKSLSRSIAGGSRPSGNSPNF